MRTLKRLSPLLVVGLLIAARLRTEELADGLLNLLSFPQLILSGVWFSLEGVNPVARAIAQVFPLAHLVDATRRVMLDGADTALPIHVYTTKGVLTPFVFQKGTPVKVVFRDERQGKPTDVFAVPMAELTPEQRAKTPLMESDLDVSEPPEPELGEATDEDRAAFEQRMGDLPCRSIGSVVQGEQLRIAFDGRKALELAPPNWNSRGEVRQRLQKIRTSRGR